MERFPCYTTEALWRRAHRRDRYGATASMAENKPSGKALRLRLTGRLAESQGTEAPYFSSCKIVSSRWLYEHAPVLHSGCSSMQK